MNFSEARNQLVQRLLALTTECDNLSRSLPLNQDAFVGWRSSCNTLGSVTALVRQAHESDRLDVLVIAGGLATNVIPTLFWYASHHDTEATRLVVLHALYREAAREMNGVLGAVVFGALDARLVK